MTITSNSDRQRALRIIQILRKATAGMPPPAAQTIIQMYGRNPFLVLISCILSLRTKDTVSLPASIRLFELAQTPQAMAGLARAAIEQAIYPVGFYHTKAATIQDVSSDIRHRFGGQVPNTRDELMSFKGVGLKTANLVLGEGFGIPALCVDVHVHRISNRLGLVRTKTPEETEAALQLILPPELWVEYNRLLVMWGQNICVPISPFCSKCPLFDLCPRVGVKKSR